MTPEQRMFMLMQMRQYEPERVATTMTPKIAQGPAPLQQLTPAKEVQIEQRQQTEAEKFKQAAKIAALNAGMSNTFKAGATKAAATNPMAMPLVLASSMFLKEGDKVELPIPPPSPFREEEQTDIRGKPVSKHDDSPSTYVGMNKQIKDHIFGPLENWNNWVADNLDPSLKFSKKFARKSGGQDFSRGGPGGAFNWIRELDMTKPYIPGYTLPWAKYGYDYGKIRDEFLKNPLEDITGLPWRKEHSKDYKEFIWNKLSRPEQFEIMKKSGWLDEQRMKQFFDTGDTSKLLPQEVSMDDDDVTYTPLPGGHLEHWDGSTIYFPRTWYGDPLGMSTLREALNRHNNYIIDLPGYHSKGNKVKKPGYYSKGNKVPGYYNEGEEVEGGTPWWRLGPLARLFGRGKRLPPDMVEAKPPPTPDDPEFGKPKGSKFGMGRIKPAIYQLPKNGIPSVIDPDAISGPSRTAWEKHLDKMMRDLPKKKYDRFMENFRKLSITDQNAWLENREREFRYNEYQKELEKDLKNARMSKSKAPDSLWNQVKKGFKNVDDAALKFVKAPLSLPLTAAGIALGGSPLNNYTTDPDNDYTPNVEPPIFDQDEIDYMQKRQLWDQMDKEQQSQIHKPVYKTDGGLLPGTTVEKLMDYVPVEYQPGGFRGGNTQMRSGYPASFYNTDTGSDNNSSFTDQVMGGNVNLWGPLSLDWNHGFGGQIGVGMDVPIMGGKAQWP